MACSSKKCELSYFPNCKFMQVNTMVGVETVLADLSSLPVVPLLQLALARGSPHWDKITQSWDDWRQTKWTMHGPGMGDMENSWIKDKQYWFRQIKSVFDNKLMFAFLHIHFCQIKPPNVRKLVKNSSSFLGGIGTTLSLPLEIILKFIQFCEWRFPESCSIIIFGS